MSKPVLYTFAFSPTAQRVVATLAHKGVDYESVEVDVSKKERPAPFTAVSPFGKVPALVHGGHNLIESTVINEYIEEVWPKPAMLPADPGGRAYARQWIVFFNRVVADPDGEFVHIERDRERKVAIARRIFPQLQALDRELKGKDKLFLGDSLSLVDVAIAPFTRLLGFWSELVGDTHFAGYRNLRAYFDRLRAHPVLAKPVYSVPDEPLRGFFKAILVDGLTVP